MKKLFIRKMRMVYFQKFDFKEVTFNSVITDISGDNGTGKTSIYSAMTWLLFGKDAYGREKFDIKHLVDGKKRDRVDVEVTAEFSLIKDGVEETLVLRRILAEKWNEKTNVYQGDETRCYINGVPSLVTEYDTYVHSIVDEESFKMITSVNYFLSLPMATQREYLCRMAGVKSIEEIAATRDEWKSMLALKPNAVNIEGWTKMVKEQLKRHKDELKGIQPSINSLVESMPEERNWLQIEQEAQDIKKSIDELNSQISSREQSNYAILAEIKNKRTQVEKLNAKISDIEREINSEINSYRAKLSNEIYKKNFEYNSLQSSIDSLSREISKKKTELNSKQAEYNRLDVEVEQKMEQYNTEREKVFISDEYPVCPLATEIKCVNDEIVEKFNKSREQLKEQFEVKKAKLLDAIITEGKALYAQREEVKNQIVMIESELMFRNSELETKTGKISTMHKEEPRVMTAEEEQAIREKHESEKMLVLNEIEKLKDELTETSTKSVDNSSVLEERNRQMELYTKKVKQLSERTQIARMNAEIEKLHKKGAELSDKITQCENTIFTLTEINRAMVDDAAMRINKMFQVTHWQTVVQQKNGDYKDVCIPTIDGVSASLNTASRINVGIDIAMAISQYLGIRVPLFIDNKESINTLVDIDTQLVTLTVAPKGTPLTIK